MHPVIFKSGPVTIYSYGLLLAISFLLGIWLAGFEARRKGLETSLIYDFSPYIIILGLIGARLYYVLFFDLKWYAGHPLDIFAIWKGGLAIHGGIIGAAIAGVWFVRKRDILFFKFADTLTPSFIIGQAIGRLGCFLNGCCFGTPTDLPWAIRFPQGSSAYNYYGSSVPLHPTQLYHIFADASIFIVIWLLRKRLRTDGFVFFLYLILYSAMRFIIEYFRQDSLYLWNTHIKAAQFLSIIIIVISIPFLFKLKRSSH